VTDVVDVLVAEHERIRQLCADVLTAGPADKGRVFAQLERVVLAHETGDRALVHPAARESTPTADAVAVACMTEEGEIERALGDLHEIGVDDGRFDAKFAGLRRVILDHNAHEERDEFPLLRLFVRAQRLHMMVGQLHDIEVMAAH
jgi:hemerythrin superfamily protein